MPYAGRPQVDRPVPPSMVAAVGGAVELVWENEAGGLTGRAVTGPGRYVKWNPVGSGESLVAEAERLAWLVGRHPVPQVLALIVTVEAEVLVTSALPGRSAVDPVWVARADDAVRAIAEGLRRLHSLPVASCPFDWGVDSRIAVAAERGIVVPEALREPPPVDQLVVSHGDACAPNTLIGADGAFLAHVDVARVGVADRWADLAVATMSFGWNYPNPREDLFWETYGVDPDPVRIEYYRARWNAT